MAKFQDLEILESAAYRQRNDRRFGGTPGQLSVHQQHQHLTPQSVFLTSPEDSSFTFVLTDLPKSSPSGSINQSRPQIQSLIDRHGSVTAYPPSEYTQSYYNSDQSSRTLPHKHHSKLHLDFQPNPEAGSNNYSTIEPRKQHPHKVKGTNQNANLIEFGSPPNSPLKSPSNYQQPHHYSVPGNFFKTCGMVIC